MEYRLKKEHKAPKEYTRGVQKGRTQTHSHLYLSQVRNSTKEFKLSTLYNLAHDHKENKKEDFILRTEGVSFSKAALFLSFYSVQNKQRGVANQTLPLFADTSTLPNKEKLANRQGVHPVIVRNGQQKIPQHLNSRTMDKQMVYCFLLLFT